MLSLFATATHNLITFSNTTQAALAYTAAFGIGSAVAIILVLLDIHGGRNEND